MPNLLYYDKIIVIFVLDYLFIYFFGIILEVEYGLLFFGVCYNDLVIEFDLWLFSFYSFVRDHISKIFVLLVKCQGKIIPS